MPAAAPRIVTVDLPYRPFYQQWEVHQAKAVREVGLFAGIRGGKSRCAGYHVLSKCILQENWTENQRRLGHPYRVWIAAKTFRLLNQSIIPAFRQLVPKELDPRYHGTDHRLSFQGMKTRTEITFMHGDPESWVADSLNGVWIDEAAQVVERCYDEARGRLMDTIGWLVLSGTPEGPNWVYHRFYLPWEKEGHTAQRAFFRWRSMDNPYLDRAEIARDKREMPEKFFNRRYLATFDSFAGQVYDEFDHRIHVEAARDEAGRDRFTFLRQGKPIGPWRGPNAIAIDEVAYAMDWGFGENNPGVLLCFGLAGGRWWALDEQYEARVYVHAGADSWLNRARRMMAKWGEGSIYCDNAPENVALFSDAGFDVWPAEKGQGSVMAGIQVVAKYLHPDGVSGEPRLLLLDTCRNLIAEFPVYHLDEKKEQPVKSFDHALDATRYLLTTYEKYGGWNPEPNFRGGG